MGLKWFEFFFEGFVEEVKVEEGFSLFFFIKKNIRVKFLVLLILNVYMWVSIYASEKVRIND